MNKQTGFAWLAAVLALTQVAAAQQVWTGFDFEFQKRNFADWTLPENQDRITNGIWITRADIRGLFNAALEDGYNGTISPADTQWATGNAIDYQDLTFTTWFNWVEGNPPGTVGVQATLHLVSDDIYIDIMFTQWTQRFNGGGFTYLRGVPAPATLPVMGLAFLGLTRRRRGV